MGDGIKLAVEIGAATAGLGHVMFHGPMFPPSDHTRIILGNSEASQKVISLNNLVWEPYTLWVNARGRRFVDEGYNYSSFAHANVVAQQPGGIMYSIYTDQILKKN